MTKTLINSYSNYECNQITVADLSVSVYVNIIGNGKVTTWQNVQIPGWIEYENAGCGVTKGKHYWFSSRILGTYRATCDKSWFYGSQILATDGANSCAQDLICALFVKGAGEVNVYGSSIRVEITDPNPPSNPLILMRAVSVADDATVHIHGTGIDAIWPAGGNVGALQARNGGEIHANSSAYNLVGGTAQGYTKVRIDNQGGHVHAPYLWEQHPTPPGIVNIGADGADMAIETASGGVMNLLVNSSSCTGAGGQWYNVVTRQCR